MFVKHYLTTNCIITKNCNRNLYFKMRFSVNEPSDLWLYLRSQRPRRDSPYPSDFHDDEQEDSESRRVEYEVLCLHRLYSLTVLTCMCNLHVFWGHFNFDFIYPLIFPKTALIARGFTMQTNHHLYKCSKILKDWLWLMSYVNDDLKS